MFKLQEKSSAIKRKQTALQYMKFLNFFSIFVGFLPFWIRIRNPNADSDPLAWLNLDTIREFGSESETLPERTIYPFIAMKLLLLKTSLLYFDSWMANIEFFLLFSVCMWFRCYWKEETGFSLWWLNFLWWDWGAPNFFFGKLQHLKLGKTKVYYYGSQDWLSLKWVCNNTV
jgi:hypothetical protein